MKKLGLAVAILLAGCAHQSRIADPESVQARVDQTLPVGEDVYVSLERLSDMRDAGVIDGFRFIEEGEEAFYAWKMDENGTGGVLMRLDMKNHLHNSIQSKHVDALPPKFPADRIDRALAFATPQK
jgi:hypothetical protein